jgi:radical SAM protein with 4Fe4S-binding SPASM domain
MDAFPQDTDFLALLEPAFEHFLGLPSHWLVEMYIPWAQYHPTSKRFKNRLRVDYVGCRAGRDRLTVGPCGDISFCVCLDEPELYLGNIRRDTLEDIFRDSGLCDMMRNPAGYEICNDCSNITRCGGGCRVAAYALSGRIDGQDELCPVYMASLNR